MEDEDVNSLNPLNRENEEEKGITSGFLKNLTVSAHRTEEEKEEKEEEKGGIIRNIISNGGGKKIGKRISELFEGGEAVKKEEEEVDENGGRGGILDSIVSHLPAKLQGEAVTSTDEATILIHSVIHD